MKQKSFTLIELLVVIAIIGLLSAITLIAIKEAREDAKEKASLQFSASIYHALGAYIIGEWNFNDGTMNDSSGNGNDVTFTNGSCYVTDDGSGIIGEAYKNEGGSTCNMNISGEGTKLNINSGAITIESWIKPSGTLNPLTVVGSGFYSLMIYVDPNENSSFAIYYGPTAFDLCHMSFSTAGEIKINEWNHAAATYNGSTTLKVYLNGKEIASEDDCPGDGVYNEEPLYLNLGFSFDATLYDEIKIYDASLSSSQIKKLYVEGAEKRGLLVEK